MSRSERARTRFLRELDWWIEQNGTAIVPQKATSRDVDGESYPLGTRVKAARAQYRAGTLDTQLIAALEQRAGWSWDGYSSRSAHIWAQRFQDLRDYLAEHGSLAGLDHRRPDLARWLREQRTTTLTVEQRRSLGKIPSALDDRKSKAAQFAELLTAWAAAAEDRTAGDVRYSSTLRHGQETFPIGRRAAYWRARYAADELTSAEISILEAVDGWQWRAPSRARGDSR